MKYDPANPPAHNPYAHGGTLEDRLERGRQTRAALVAEAEALFTRSDTGVLDDTGRARFEAIEAELAQITEAAEQIDRIQSTMARAGDQCFEGPQTAVARRAEFNVNTRTADPFDLSRVPVDETREHEIRSRAEDAIERSTLFAEDAHKESATQVVANLDGSPAARTRTAEQVLVQSNPAYASGFAKRMAGEDWQLEPEERRQLMRGSELLAEGDYYDRAQTLALTTGLLVPAHLDPSVALTNDGSSSTIRPLARVIPVTTNVWTGVSSDGIVFGWSGVDDQVEVGDDAPSFDNPTVTVHMWDAFVPMTVPAYEDWFSASEEILMMVGDARDQGHEQSFCTGSGTNQPYGIITALTGTASQVNHATNSTFTYTDLLAAKNSLGRRYRKRASWVAEDGMYDRIRGFGTSEGALYSVSLSDDSPARVLGKKAYDCSGFSSTINSAATNFSMVYGDLKAGYVIAERVGTIAEVVPHLFSTSTGRPTMRRGILCHGRIGGNVVDANALTLSVNPKATA